KPSADVCGTAQLDGHRLRNGVRSENGLDDFLRHDGKAEGHEDLFGVGALVEVLDDATFQPDADQEHDGNGDEDRDGYRIVDQNGTEIAEPGLNERLAHLKRRTPG